MTKVENTAGEPFEALKSKLWQAGTMRRMATDDPDAHESLAQATTAWATTRVDDMIGFYSQRVPKLMRTSRAILSFGRVGVLLAFALLVSGCDRGYVIEGNVVVARGAGASVVPAVLCVGKGGPLDASGVYAHPARTMDSSAATLFCGPAPDDVEFPLHETITQGWMPRLAHVYAWLEPVPAAKKMCAEQGEALVPIDIPTLERLVSPEDANKPPTERAPVSYPCERNPTPAMPMAYAVTFDPDHETWSKSHGTYVEKRDLRIE